MVDSEIAQRVMIDDLHPAQPHQPRFVFHLPFRLPRRGDSTAVAIPPNCDQQLRRPGGSPTSPSRVRIAASYWLRSNPCLTSQTPPAACRSSIKCSTSSCAIVNCSRFTSRSLTGPLVSSCFRHFGLLSDFQQLRLLVWLYKSISAHNISFVNCSMRFLQSRFCPTSSAYM